VSVTHSAAPRWPDNPALFLDLDGTLLDFALDPAKVEVSGRLQRILGKLPAATHGAIAFVSGRTLADLDRLLGHGRFPLAAVHGLERRDAHGHLSTAVADSNEFERMYEILRAIASDYAATSVEHKGVTLALHYRRCPELEEQLVERVEAGLKGMASQLKLMRGKMVLEIKPAEGDKGTAIAAFMREEPFRGRTPVFVGDDVTDEDGFRAVNRLDGISVKVASGQSSARYRLPDKDAVIDWLEELVTRE
jgi:trehalose 6-phosphate phosphatase